MWIFLFVFGLFVGSFLNVLADRLPKNENPFVGRSHCDYCKKTLKWYDLIPLFSFLSTGGKCRYCRHKLSYFYPVIELSTAVLFASVTLKPALGIIDLIFYHFIISCMVVVFFSDLRYGIIPDGIVFVGVLTALIYLILFPKSLNYDPIYNIFVYVTQVSLPLLYYLASGLVSFFLFLFLFLITKGNAMGFGDVKFSFLLGLVLGPMGSVIALYVAFLTGAMVGLILILWRKKRFREAIPFGPFLVLGFLISFFFAPQIISIL